MKTAIHAGAGAVVLCCLVIFWTSTLVSELFFAHEAVLAVKIGIVKGMWLLIPAMAMVGSSGFLLASGRAGHLVDVKKRRMRIVCMNGVLIMLPCALFLSHKATAGQFDMAFYAVQVVELAVGTVQLLLIGRNVKDGLALAGRLRRMRQ